MKPLDAQIVSLELIRTLKPIAKSCDAGLAEQLRRAANSIVLNIAEADGRVGRDRINRFRIARGSALEVVAAVELAIAWGYIKEAPQAAELLDRLGAMLWRLTR